ncbi:MAG: UbiX family flavin prenyltransferase [Candidatus Thermoplasmatota archaeon]|jgi:4-hydroxy-3-polyprenylbenzoate decarboxylase|nr:UbiX family flavin prenyltransferase [Candidatus Thermoplasmatota archaeon]
MNMIKERYLIAMTGASGIRYGTALLRVMKEMKLDLDLILSENAKEILNFEGAPLPEVPESGSYTLYSNKNLFSPPASGSVRYSAMIIIPCSMSTAGKINSCIGDNLITRAAQVMLKEARKLIIVPRETPLSTQHLKMLYDLSRSGTIVVPASPGFYHHPKDITDLENFMCQKILGLLGMDANLFEPFSGRLSE